MSASRPLRVAPGTEIPRSEVTIRASRSGGPGGQHANVTASRVEAVFDVGSSRALSEDQKRRIRARLGPVITAVAQDSRGQARNRELALARLEERLRAALHRPRRRRATSPTRAAKQRRLDSKRHRSERKRMRRRPPIDD
jgi:ribosome-associated protein